MTRFWLVGLGFLLAIGVVSCGTSSGTSGGNVRIVAADDGAVEVIVGGKTTFTLAATGPVARW